MTRVIGSIHFVPKSGFQRSAELSDAGVWTSDEPRLADFLNVAFAPARASCPEHGPFGTMLVQLAAAHFGGEAKLSHFAPPVKGRTY